MSKTDKKIILPKKQRANLKFGKNAVIVLALFGIYCFVNVWQNVSITYLNRQNETLRKELESLERECDVLTLKVEELKKPERILKVLGQKMEIVPAEKLISGTFINILIR